MDAVARGDEVGVGRVFDGRYQADARLGSGGMGVVWRGRDLRLDRPVAIKELGTAGLIEPNAAERFDREARTLARLAHPNIVTVHDFGVDGGASYLVLELVDGPSVADLLERGPLPVEQAVDIAAQTCDGLAAAHAAGIVHRDIKPANLILTPAGVVKICDFGIASIFEELHHDRLTSSAVAMGSSSFMAPEQAEPEPVDGRADLYALGCTLYAMLAGEPPFAGGNAVSVLHRHVNEPAPPLSTRRPDAPAALAALIAELLAKDPADRPAGAARVRERLTAALDDTATVVLRSPAPLVGRDHRSAVMAKDRAWRWVVGGVAVVAAAAIALPLIAGRSSPSEAEKAAAVPAGPVEPSAAAPASPSVQQRIGAAPTGSPAPIAPTRQPTARSSPPPSPIDPIAAMRLAIQGQVAQGALTAGTAEELYKKVDEIAREHNEGDTDEVAKKIGELRRKLDDLRRGGKLTAGGHAVLSAEVDRLAGALL